MAKYMRIEFGSYGVASRVKSTKGARVIRNLTAIQVTAGDLQPGDIALMSPNDEPNYETLIADGGIAIGVPVTGISRSK